MAAVRSRRRSLFDSDEEAELGPSGESPLLAAALSASTSAASLQAGNGNEDGEAQAEQARLRKLEQRNSRSLFSDGEEEEEEPERPRASSSAAHRKPGTKSVCLSGENWLCSQSAALGAGCHVGRWLKITWDLRVCCCSAV